MQSPTTSSFLSSPVDSPPQSLESVSSDVMGTQTVELSQIMEQRQNETVTVELENTSITFRSSSVREGYFEVVSVQGTNFQAKNAPVIETGDILREFQGMDMRVDSERLRQLLTENQSGMVILAFEKQKWGGCLLRVSFKVMTSQLRLEVVPEWVDDPPPSRLVSPIAQRLIEPFRPEDVSNDQNNWADTSHFSDFEWKTAMLTFAEIVQDQPFDEARLALCEAMAILLLRQSKSVDRAQPSFARSENAPALSMHGSNTQLGPSEQQLNNHSQLSQTVAHPNFKKPKTLLELAQGDIDVLDCESATPSSAPENSHIEIQFEVDGESCEQVTVALAAEAKHGAKNDSISSFSAGLQSHRQNSFSSPANTPRTQTLPRPLSRGLSDAVMVEPTIGSEQFVGASIMSSHPKHPVSALEPTLLGSVALPREIQGYRSSGLETMASIRITSPKEATSTPSYSPKPTAAAEAAEKAARITQQMKAAIGAQSQQARVQAVQAAAAQQNAAEVEQNKSTKILEAAYDSKVEEAAVLRRQCSKLQEMLERLQRNQNSPGQSELSDKSVPQRELIWKSGDRTEAEKQNNTVRRLEDEVTVTVNSAAPSLNGSVIPLSRDVHFEA